MTYHIWGRYKGTGKAEVVDEFDTKDEAEKMVREYRIAYGSDWTVWIEEVQ